MLPAVTSAVVVVVAMAVAVAVAMPARVWGILAIVI
jgi:hypothetical protein